MCIRDREFSASIGYPVIVRPAYTLGGTGGGIADDEEELREIAHNLSLIHIYRQACAQTIG